MSKLTLMVIRFREFSTLNLVSHFNNETTHCILDNALLKYT